MLSHLGERFESAMHRKFLKLRGLIAVGLVTTLWISATSPVVAAVKKETMLQVLGSQTAVKARNDFLLQIKNAPTRIPNLEFHIDPTINKGLLEGVIADTALSANFWSTLRPIDQKVVVWVAPTENFQFFIDEMKPTFTAEGDYGNWLELKLATAQKYPHGFFGGGAPAFDKNDNPVFMVYAPNDQNLGSGFWTQSTAHEFVHVIQRYLMAGDMSPMFGWVVEGQADYIGANFGTRNSTEAFASYWIQLIDTVRLQSSHPEIINWNANQFIAWFKSKEITQNPATAGDIPVENYVVGAMASQYLYGTYGYKKVNMFYDNLGKIVSDCGDGDITVNLKCAPSRQKAFKDAFGVSMADFYPKVSAFIVSEIAWSKKNKFKYPTNLLNIAPSPWVGAKQMGPYVAPPDLGPISKYGNPGFGENSNDPQKTDPYPPNIPVPGRSCPSIGGVAELFGGKMTCTSPGIWSLDPGQIIGTAPK